MSQGGNLTSLLSSLINDAENGSFMITTGSSPSLFIDRYSNIGINTTNPTSQLEVASTNGSCIRLRYGSSSTAYANIFMSSNGNLAINPKKAGSEITTTSSINLIGHDGSTTGLKLNGTLVAATADQLNYVAVSPGTASASKALVLDSAQNVSGINSIGATIVAGTLATPDQPNITSVGTLTSLTVTGHLIVEGAVTVNGTTTGSIDAGTGGSSGVSGEVPTYLLNIAAGTAAPSKALVLNSSKSVSGISSLGTTSITVSGNDIGSEAAFLSGATAGSAIGGKVVVLNGAGSVTNINALSAVSLSGTLLTANQPNITSIGALESISIDGFTIQSEAGYISEVVAGTAVGGKALVLNGAGYVSGITSLSSTYLSGTIQTPQQPNITAIGPLSSLSVGGATIGSEIGYLAGAVAGTAVNSKVLVLNGVGSISGIASLTATQLTGTLQTASQPKITSVGTLSSLNVANDIVADTITGTLQTAEQPNITSIGTLSSLTVTTDIVADKITGALQTGSQPLITSVGTLSSLTVTNGISASTLTGTLQTATQPNITSVGTLSSLTVSEGISASTISGTILTASQPNITSIGSLASISVGGQTISSEFAFLSGAVEGTASNSKVLVLSGAGAISGIGALSASTLSGTLLTAIQPNITSIGTLSSLTVTNGVVASQLTGTLQTAAQPNITSIGNLLSVSIGGSIIESEASFLSGATAGQAANSKALVLSSIGTIEGIASLKASSLFGTLMTAAQPNITSIGSLISISISGHVISTEASFLSGAVAGMASNSKALVLNGAGSIEGISSLTANNLSGTLQTTNQPNITSIGTLGLLNVSGSTTLSSTTNSSSSTDGGALTVRGGVAIAKDANIGGSLIISDITGSSIQTSGGVSISKSLVVGEDTTIGGTLTVTGAFSVSGTTSYTGSTEFSDATDSVSAHTGSIFTSGGIGIAKSIFVGSNATVGGNLGVGVSSPVKKFEVNGDSLFTGSIGVNVASTGYPLYVGGVYSPDMPTSYISLNSYGSISSSSSAPVSVSIACEGRILCNGEIDVGSDYRIKDNISAIKVSDVDLFIDQINPIRFNYKNEPKRMNFGYLAQDIAKNKISELISMSPNEELEEYIDEDGFVSPAGVKFSVITGNIIPLLHMKVKTLSSENKNLKQELASMREDIISLMARLDSVENK